MGYNTVMIADTPSQTMFEDKRCRRTGEITIPDEPKWQVRIAIFVLFLLLILLRMPGILITPRLWAEEGLFYQNSWSMDPWHALLRGYGGYLNIVANAAGLIARYAAPLRDAPLVTTGIGLLFQSLPAIVILTSRATWLRSFRAMLISIIALAAGPATEEVWLQTLHSQNHLALCAALIVCFDDKQNVWLRYFRYALLLIAPLSGLLAVLVLPLLLLRTAIERSPERIIQSILLGGGALIQIGLFYSPADGAALGRSNVFWPGILLYTIFIRHLVVPVLGITPASTLGESLTVLLKAGRSPLQPVLILAVVGAFVASISVWRWRSGAVWLFAAAFSIAVVSYVGAINGGFLLLSPTGGERYAFVPHMLFVFGVVALASYQPTHWTAKIATFIATWIVAVGLLDYPRARRSMYASGPEWRTEVKLWEKDPNHIIKLWPEGWFMQLTPDHSPIWLPVRPPELRSPVPHDDKLL